MKNLKSYGYYFSSPKSGMTGKATIKNTGQYWLLNIMIPGRVVILANPVFPTKRAAEKMMDIMIGEYKADDLKTDKEGDLKIKRSPNVWGNEVIHLLVFDGSYWIYLHSVSMARLLKLGYDSTNDESVLTFVRKYEVPVK